jgi:hypothetical protein
MGLHSSQVGKARPVALDHHRTPYEYAIPDVDEDDQIYRDLIPVLAEPTGWVLIADEVAEDWHQHPTHVVITFRSAQRRYTLSVRDIGRYVNPDVII